MDDNKKIEGMLSEVLDGESSLKKISISVASAVLAASIIGSIVLYKEFIHIQDWTTHHEEVAIVHINRISTLEDMARLGGRWTLEDHNRYAERQSSLCESYAKRINLLERSKDLTDFKLETMDDKLDEIIDAIQNAVETRNNNGAM